MIPVDTVQDVFREVFGCEPGAQQVEQQVVAEEAALPKPEIFPPASASFYGQSHLVQGELQIRGAAKRFPSLVFM